MIVRRRRSLGLSRGALALGIGFLLVAGPIRSATTVTKVISVALSSFCLLGVTSSSVSLAITNPASAGAVPSDAVSTSTYAQYSSTVASGVTRRITAAWASGNSAPGGCALRLQATPASGQGSSAGQIVVSATAQNIVTGIGGCATGTGASSGALLAYTLAVTSITSLVANQGTAATITLTMTDS
jgi:hypothetical protein